MFVTIITEHCSMGKCSIPVMKRIQRTTHTLG
uniref:Uncharacterized protein n=1 Tax=Ciona intestinalis TaxID=7719 RepID=H2XXV6_CIOIN